MGGITGNTQKSKSSTTNQYAIDQYNDARSSLPRSFTPVTGDQIKSYMNPFTDSVIDANTRYADRQQAQAINANHDAAVKAGAFGGNGQEVADALTRGEFDLNNQMMAAGLRSQGYNQALDTAVGQNDKVNQYPLLLQQLLAQMAQGTQTTTRGSTSNLGFSASAGYNGGSGSWMFGG